jgi:hypothetical protein
MTLIKRPVSRFANSDTFRALAAGEIEEPSGAIHWARWNVAVGGWTPASAVADAIDLNAELVGQDQSESLVDIVPVTAFIYLVTPFAGGSVSAIVATFGHGTQGTIGADGNGFLEATSVFTGETAGYYATPAAASFGKPLVGQCVPHAHPDGDR